MKTVLSILILYGCCPLPKGIYSQANHSHSSVWTPLPLLRPHGTFLALFSFLYRVPMNLPISLCLHFYHYHVPEVPHAILSTYQKKPELLLQISSCPDFLPIVFPSVCQNVVVLCNLHLLSLLPTSSQ